MSASIFWFRQDLRISDNPGLCAACEAGELIPVYIYDQEAPENATLGGASQWWLHHALHSLADSLKQQLIVRQGSPQKVLADLVEQYDAQHIFWNRMYEPWARERDTKIKSYFSEQGIQVKSLNGSLLWEPWEVLKKDNTPYKVYTPYYRKGCLSKPDPRFPLTKPNIEVNIQVHHQWAQSASPQATSAKSTSAQTASSQNTSSQNTAAQIDALELLPKIKWDTGIANTWEVSEKAAGERLKTFIEHTITEYSDKRNLPAQQGTSLLSPYLHFGQISPNQVWYAVKDAFAGDISGQGVDTYLSEIGWREFSYYLLYHFDDMQQYNFNPKFNHFAWRKSDADLSAWQKGLTGVPIVDAGMRELYQTGYMHNRVRMIVGSYLVKNLLIDWREGERWFWDCLVDADTASNAAGWQWVAGSGADASPYFRIFNPILQGEKFDKEGEYVKRYCPELSELPKKYIHKPWEAPADILKTAGIELGNNYPNPLVDLKQSRQRALDAFAQIKNAG